MVVVRIMSGTSNGNIVFGFCFLTTAAFSGGFVATISDVYKEGGLSSFYRGFGAALMDRNRIDRVVGHCYELPAKNLDLSRLYIFRAKYSNPLEPSMMRGWL